ncbi:MAG: HipA N-terminal domain-containing protein [Polyangiaceae bacterium]|nr:HipA N-terminal domain-containing protein [Polyangiaceae bacterium]
MNAALLLLRLVPHHAEAKEWLQRMVAESGELATRYHVLRAVATSADPDLRRDGLRGLRALVTSDADEVDRRIIASTLREEGDPSGAEVLAELADHAASPRVRLEAAREIEHAAALRDLADSADDPAVRTDAEYILGLLEARRRLLQVGRFRKGVVSLSGQRAGLIEELPGGRTRFTYDDAWLARDDARPLGPSMPLRHAPYEDDGLLAFFKNLLPEGWLLDITRRKLGVAAGDPFGLLLATARDCIGAVEVTPAPDDEDAA